MGIWQRLRLHQFAADWRLAFDLADLLEVVERHVRPGGWYLYDLWAVFGQEPVPAWLVEYCRSTGDPYFRLESPDCCPSLRFGWPVEATPAAMDELAERIHQTIDGLFVATQSAAPELSSLTELRHRPVVAEVILVAFDSSFWEVYTRHELLAADIAAAFDCRERHALADSTSRRVGIAGEWNVSVSGQCLHLGPA